MDYVKKTNSHVEKNKDELMHISLNLCDWQSYLLKEITNSESFCPIHPQGTVVPESEMQVGEER